ncbi:phospholipase A1-Igamma3, chloroplastic-like [Tripterygium wilfordii]|uniref:phospholipase A1-Igamma3, chloroplastic-like n=1 Tax=Tripterygium wilfordii TaxID=458696 RepID=UPI0018F84B9D|nr:phospholipase A1-Igamma3, chloroplastic-like [Tripterygium wilfordii]
MAALDILASTPQVAAAEETLISTEEDDRPLHVKVLRVINVHDKVPKIPGMIANEKSRFQKYMENMSFPRSYAHAPNTYFRSAHNLEAHLHLVDGYHGKGGRFCLVSKRDIALINKICDFLKEDYGVPPYWRQEANKGMVKNGGCCWTGRGQRLIHRILPTTLNKCSTILLSQVNLDIGDDFELF